MTDADHSPDILSGPPRRGPGVRRLNRVPLLIASLVLAMILGAVAYTYHLRSEAGRKQEGQNKSDASSAITVLNNAQDAGFIQSKLETPQKQQDQTPPLQTQQTQTVLVEPQPDPRKLAWEAYYQQLEQRRQFREQALIQAAFSNTAISVPQQVKKETTSTNTPASSLSSVTEQFANYASARLKQLDNGDGNDLNHQNQKREFLNDCQPQSQTQNTLQAIRELAQSPYEVKAGTIIPAVMIGGVNSDLPGQLLGQVAENVYDTATGRFILIPQGAKLIGVSDSGVTTGQERVLVAWTRIIYPDGSSLDLGKMPGSDQGGYAGFHDQVNDHFWKIFGNAILLSAFSSGIQLSQGNGNNQTSGLNATQTLAASTGQQLGQLGQEIARRNLQIQPTLEIRPGYRFVIEATKDLVLRPWRQRTITAKED